ncbi:N-acetylneuraminate synthase family protein [Planktomarina temperata]|nr:N-acetylneuraminate synthase family protein [Planktomarina temperata]MDB2459782.1 N-acetylneuraminate synthase family protein [Planktomarina temperata]
MNVKSFEIENRKIGKGHPTFIVAEVGQAHDGSLGLAHSFIDSAADAGADAIKFQTHFAAEESSRFDEFRVKFSYEDETRFDYWKRLEFTDEQWANLKDHCDSKGIVFLSSAFSDRAVTLLSKLKMPAWKVASGETRNLPFIDRILGFGQPLLVSNGLSSDDELQNIKTMCDSKSVPVAFLQCTSSYPCEPETIDINGINRLRDQFGCPSGLSDHSGNLTTSIAAMSLGADILEIHITYDRGSFGPDSKASLNISELSQLIKARNYLHRLFQQQAEVPNWQLTRRLFGKSFYSSEDIQIGQTITWDNVQILKPENGILASQYEIVIGSVATRNIKKGEAIIESDIKIDS